MKYQALTHYILQRLPKDYQRNFYSWIESGELINSGREITEQGGILSIMRTDCILWFEELPFRKINPQKIMALIQIWLNENTNCDVYDEQNNTISFELVLIDDNTADLNFRLTFNEPIYLTQDEQGDLVQDGEHYRLANPEIWTATDFSVEAKIRFKQRWQKQD